MSVDDLERAFRAAGFRTVRLDLNTPAHSVLGRVLRTFSRFRPVRRYVTYSVRAVLERAY